MASWVNGMLGQCGGLPGGLPPMAGGACGCSGCGGLATQPAPDRDGVMRAFFECAATSGAAAESPCTCGEDAAGIDDLFLPLDWVPINKFQNP